MQPETQEDAGPRASGDSLAATAPTPVDEGLIAQLVDMGFSEPGSRRAAAAVNSAGPEVAMEWLLAHMDDAGINDPLPDAAAGGPSQPSAEAVSALTGMGFTPAAANAALQACAGDVERAADWLFSRMDSLAELECAGPESAEAGPVAPRVRDGAGEYELSAFISHMGANTACGHYVCHIKKVSVHFSHGCDCCRGSCEHGVGMAVRARFLGAASLLGCMARWRQSLVLKVYCQSTRIELESGLPSSPLPLQPRLPVGGSLGAVQR